MTTALYVSTQGKDTWSGTLAAPNAEGTDGPLASLAAARDAMRAGVADTTYVRGGTYHLARTLELDVRDAGHTFAAYQGEKPVISGGEVVRGFRDEGNGLYSAALAQRSDLDLTVGGVRQHVAQTGVRDPADPAKSGWQVIGDAPGGASKSVFTARGTVPESIVAHDGLKVQALDYERLSDRIADVTAIDRGAHTITLGQESQYALRAGGTYRLMNDPALIRDAGDFAWRDTDHRLVFKPQDPAHFEEQGVVVPRLGTLVTLNKTHDVELSGLTFTDGRWDGAAVVLSGGHSNELGGNTFSNVGTGVAAYASTGNRIAGNTLRDLADSGITLRQASDGNRVYANVIEHIGTLVKGGAGIGAVGSSHLTISHNDITDVPRYGISLKEWGDGQLNQDNLVEGNRIRHAGQETADGGGIEMLGRSARETGSVIRGNVVEDTGGLATERGSGAWLTEHKGWGISLDDLTSGVTVDANRVTGSSWANIYVHGGHDNTVTNNAGIVDNPGDSFIRVEWVPKAGDLGRPADNVVTGNTIQGAQPMDHYATLLTPGTLTLDDNLLHNVPAKGAADVVADHAVVTATGDGTHDAAWASAGAGGFAAGAELTHFW